MGEPARLTDSRADRGSLELRKRSFRKNNRAKTHHGARLKIIISVLTDLPVTQQSLILELRKKPLK